ncbi:MAG: CCA tRNA nucleotidyltransferase [Azospirillaceae bacterium]|nr:CCA tRNA nucleotidyltransferase [Azospirillaceae bacterium]
MNAAAVPPLVGGPVAGRLVARAWLGCDAAAALFDALSGVSLRFVGGCVRDTLLGRPIADFDLATDAVPTRTLALLRRAGFRALPTGIAHGTITALVDHQPFEITTLRRDVETDGRHAVVRFTDDWREDAARRDFTVNAMSCDRDLVLSDYFDGVADLRAGRIRFVGDPEQRIREDVLRLLRFFRFHARFGRGDPDPAALDAATRLAPLLPTLSAERVRDETLKLLATAAPVATWRLMIERGITAFLLPEADNIAALTRLVADDQADPLLRLAALLPPDPAVLAATAQRLRLSNVEAERLTRLGGTIDLAGPFAGLLYEQGPALVGDLARVTAARRGGDPGPALAAAAAWRGVTFPLSGRDVLALGLRPGPAVGAVLAAVEAWWRDQGFGPDRVACLGELRRRVQGGEAS